jgi:dTDP-glucose 4,6-dehydratase
VAAPRRPADLTRNDRRGSTVKQFITGGAGFIGSNYVRQVLAETDDEVTVYDALTYAGNLSTLRDVDDSPRYRFVKGNICDPGSLEEAMAGHDVVVHFAAESHVDRSILGPDDFVNTNCFGTNVVMDTARRLEVPRVVHIGTDEVYGSVETGSSKETDPLEPRSPYSASKAGSDLIALSYFSTYGLPVTVTRCTNNFGPYQFPEKVIPLFTTNLIDDQPVPLYGDGLNERDWIHVDDHCRGVRLVLEKGNPGEVYNIGAGNETPNRVLVDKLLEKFGVGEEKVNYVADRLGHDRRYSVDISKVTALGWEKRRTLDEALDETVAWYKANEWWWRPLKERSAL